MMAILWLKEKGLSFHSLAVKVQMYGLYIALGTLTFVFLGWLYLKLSHHQDFKSLGYGKNRVFIGGWGLVGWSWYWIWNYNAAEKSFQKIQEELPTISNFLQREITVAWKIRSWWTGFIMPPLVILIAKRFPSVLAFSQAFKRAHLKSGEYLLGEKADGTSEKSSIYECPNILATAETAGGKGVFAGSLALSLLKSSPDIPFGVVILDPKLGSDYGFLQEHAASVAVLNPGLPKDLEQAVTLLRETHSSFQETIEIMRRHGVKTVRALREKGVPFPTQPRIFIFDEFSDYGLVTKTTPTEFKSLQQELIDLTNRITRIARVFEVVTICMLQNPSENAVAIDYVNFKVRVIGNVNTAFSQFILGSDLAHDPTLTKGLFIAKYPGGVSKIKSPIVEGAS